MHPWSRRNGLVYAALMATQGVLLWHAARADWSCGDAGLGFSVAILALALRWARLLVRSLRKPAEPGAR